MGAIASQITSLTLVYSAVYLGANQWKHQRSASLAFVTRGKCFHLMTSPWPFQALCAQSCKTKTPGEPLWFMLLQLAHERRIDSHRFYWILDEIKSFYWSKPNGHATRLLHVLLFCSYVFLRVLYKCCGAYRNSIVLHAVLTSVHTTESGVVNVRWCHLTWWRHQMEKFSALLALCAGNSPVPGEFPSQRTVARSFDIFLDLHRNKRLSKQSWGWWFETQSRPLWRHSYVAAGEILCDRLKTYWLIRIKYVDGILLINK